MVQESVHLPEELIIEIMLRLPVKTVLCCKCVCKSWHSFISDPNFATSHFEFAASPTNRLVCLGNYSETLSIDSETLSIDLNASLTDDSSHASLSLDFLYGRDIPEFGGSCRGFMLLHCDRKYDGDFYVWNPSTGVHKQIPPSPITIASNNSLLIFLYGFAYDHSTDDYLIVLGSSGYNTSYDPASSSIDLEIFSLRGNNWKKFEVDSLLPSMTTAAHYKAAATVGLLLDETIHWMVINRETLSNYIIAFDLKERRMSEIALPDDFRVTDYADEYDLLVLDGNISAWIVEKHTVKIWVMQKYAAHSSWTKTLELTLQFSFDPVLHFSLSLVCITNCGDMIVTDGWGVLMKFNDKGQLLEHHSNYDGNFYFERFQMTLYTESLLPLPSCTGQ